MTRRLALALAGAALFSLVGWRPEPLGAPGATSGETSVAHVMRRSPLAEATLLARERENGCVEGSAAAPGPQSWPDWAAAHIAGGDVPPARVVSDPYPTLHSVAVDPEHNRVVVSDPNRHALWTYDRLAASAGGAPVVPLTGIRGPSTGMMFIAAVAVDPKAQEIYTVDNDIGDRLMVFPYGANGNVKPTRVLNVPHQAWGVSINPVRDEIAVTVEGPREVMIYRRQAQGDEAALRIIRGPKTDLGDPHGVYFDGTHNEIVVANHGNQNGRRTQPGDAPPRRRGAAAAAGAPGAPGADEPIVGGHFDLPSIAVYGGEAKGDVAPVRQIVGAKTGLNWPMAVSVDEAAGEIAVANSGDSSIRIFDRAATGDAAPVRVIKGARTGIHGPMGVTFDPKNNEIWVANYGDHTALVFAHGAQGNVPPVRVIRNAPEGSPTVGFGNPGAVAYDSKRDEILVPN